MIRPFRDMVLATLNKAIFPGDWLASPDASAVRAVKAGLATRAGRDDEFERAEGVDGFTPLPDTDIGCATVQ